MKRIIYLTTILFSQFLLVGPGLAADGGAAKGARGFASSQISLEQAVVIAKQKRGGRVLSARSEATNGAGTARHHVRLLVGGERVVTVIVGSNGRIVSGR